MIGGVPIIARASAWWTLLVLALVIIRESLWRYVYGVGEAVESRAIQVDVSFYIIHSFFNLRVIFRTLR